MIQDPIVALATPPGTSALAVIRMTGDGCHSLVLPVLSINAIPKIGKMQFCRLTESNGELVDEVMVCFASNPRSFTGEDTVELFCHGSPFIIGRALQLLYKTGFRQAEAGEFTRRAYLNSKIDLLQVEGIGAMIHSQTEGQWQAAKHLLTGGLSDHVSGLRNDLIAMAAQVNAMIDFPDEGDVQHLAFDKAVMDAKAVHGKVCRLANTYHSGKVAADGLRVVLFGPTNAGKSTLLNTLLNQERAIVSREAGTTRDYIEESLMVEGCLVRLVDTAGLRETAQSIESIGIEHTKKLAESADLILLLVPAAETSQTVADLRASLPADKRVIVLRTKADSGESESLATGELALSCRTGFGLSALKAELAAAVKKELYVVDRQRGAFITKQRHLDALRSADDGFKELFIAIDEGRYEECIAFELSEIIRKLSQIIGDVDVEDILEKIFSEFCVGK